MEKKPKMRRGEYLRKLYLPITNNLTYATMEIDLPFQLIIFIISNTVYSTIYIISLRYIG